MKAREDGARSGRSGEASFSLRFLGGCELAGPGGPVRLESAKTTALLAYLALKGGPQTRQKLMGMFWADLPEGRAAGNLRRALWDQGRRLSSSGGPLVVADRQSVRFNRAVGCFLDVAEFQRACDSPGKRAAEGTTCEPAVVAELAAAVELYRGDLLDGFFVSDAPGFEEWLFAERERLRDLALHTLDRLVRAYRQRGDHVTALAYARRSLTFDPWREQAHRTVMELLALVEQPAAALAQFETCRRVLAEELNATPSAETSDLRDRIRSGRLGAPSGVPTPPGASPPADAPAILGGEAPPAMPPPNNLPLPPTPFVARGAELEAIGTLLADPTCRLVTLLGPGGIGKTRLAVQAARACLPSAGAVSFADGVAFVPVAENAQPGALVPAIAGALGLTFSDGVSARSQLLAHLSGKRLLIVLDGLEHSLSDVDLVTEVLGRAAEVKLLATSRERLRVSSEWVFEVGGLDLPAGAGNEALRLSGAVQLFLQAARRARFGFDLGDASGPLVAAICRRVEGMPLGIELAAGCLRTLTLEEVSAAIVGRLEGLSSCLRDIPEGHRSLGEVFEGSWRSLSDGEREAASVLSVFVGGFSRAAAIRVAGADLAALASLVDKSMLRREPGGRYQMHEVLRHLARHRLDADPARASAAERAHAGYFLSFLGERSARLRERGYREAMGEIAVELDNISSAWWYAVGCGDVEACADAADALAGFHEVRGWFREADALLSVAIDTARAAGVREVGAPLGRLLTLRGGLRNRTGAHAAAVTDLEEALRALASTGLARYLALATFHLGDAAYLQGQYRLARHHLEQALRVAQGNEEGAVITDALARLGRVALEEGAHAEARARLEESLMRARRAGDGVGTTNALNQLGYVAYFQGRYHEARAHFEEVLPQARQDGNRVAVVNALNGLGFIAEDLKRLDEAAASYEQGLVTAAEIGDRQLIARLFTFLGEVARKRGDHPEARRRYEEALSVCREINCQYLLGANLGNLAFLAAAAGERDETLDLVRGALSVARITESVSLALPGVVAMAELAAREGDTARAASLLGLVLDHPAIRTDTRIEAERVLDGLREVARAEDLSAGLAAGKALDLEAVLGEMTTGR